MSRALLSIAILLLGLRPALADPSEIEVLRARSAALEQRVEELERALQTNSSQAGCDAVAAPESWRNRQNWERLRKGMSRFDVWRILGEPGKVSSYDGFERWEYPDLLGGRVSFDDAGVLSAWRPPPPPSRPTTTVH